MPSGKHFLKKKTKQLNMKLLSMQNMKFFAGDTRGEEAGGLLPPLQESSPFQGDHEPQGGQRQLEEPGPSPPGAGHGVRGAHAGRDLARAGGRHTVYEILTPCNTF